MIVISASSSGVGSTFTCVSTRKIWRPGSTRPFIAAYTLQPGRLPITWSMKCRWRCVVLIVPQIMPSASPFFTSIEPISVVRRRISTRASCSLMPLRAIIL